MDTLLCDLRFALRSLRKSPGFTLVVVLILALGIGAATTIFSVVNALILRPLPFTDSARLVRVWETNPHTGNFSASDANYLDFAERNRGFAEMAAYSETRNSLTLTGGCESEPDECEAERLQSAAVTSTLFPLLGVRPMLGRTFAGEEGRPGGNHQVAVVSHDLWQRSFGADPEIVGRSLTLDGESYTVTGVMPAGFEFPVAADVWIPLAPNPARDRDEHDIAMVARLAPGVTLTQASADLNRVARDLGAEHPRTNAGWGVHLASFSEWIVGPQLRQAMYVLLGAVGFLLLMACANVANLLIARGTTRQTEMGIRAALGAGRSRIVRQLLTESMLLGIFGAAAGVGIALWAVDALRAVGPRDIPRIGVVSVDARVLLFALVVGLLTSLIFGLTPAMLISRVKLHEALKQGARRGLSGGGRVVRNALVVVEVALAMTLLVGAGLMIGSFVRLQRVPSGFDAEQVLTVPLQLPANSYSHDQLRTFFRAALTRIAAIPGVTAAGATTTDPFRQWGFSNDVTPTERAAQAPEGGFMQSGWRSVTPGFFRAMGIPLLRGRVLSAADRADGARVTVISETLAGRLWPGEDPIGKGLFWGGKSGTPLTVVGVVGDIRDVRLEADPPPLMFLPYDQTPMAGMTLVIKTAGNPANVAGAVRQAIRSIDKNLPVPEMRPLDEGRASAVAEPRFRMLLLGTFAAVALVLATMGIYGVMAFTVAQRTREIGVRMALGARPGGVSRMIIRQGMILTLIGMVLGTLGALSLTRVLASLLFDTAPTDPATFAVVTVLLVGVALLATYLPARRAMRVDPVIALRSE